MLDLPSLSPTFFLLLTSILSVSNATPTRRASERCLPGQSCFPSQQALNEFNSTIGGRLFAERPVEAVCFVKDPLYNFNSCLDYKQHKTNDEWITQHFASLEQTNWEECGYDDSCLHTNFLDGTCGQGSVSKYAVHAQTADDVQKYVQFATKNNLRIVVKNTGHDYKGRSAGKDGFAVWTHNLQEKSFDASFVPKGCSADPQPALSFGAGVVWDTAYEFADQNKKLVVGGDAGFVGASGGWLQGGGHSFNTPAYGMGVDNLLEMDIVTADGQLQTISECSNPDLFFAVRGGGGGTWGVATRVTYKAHDSVPIQSVLSVATGLSLNSNAIEDIIERLAESAPKLSDIGGGGVVFISPVGLFILGTLPGGTMDQLKEAFEPALKNIVSIKGLGLTIQPSAYVTFSSYYELYKATIGPVNEPVGIPAAISSRLITRDAFKDPKAVAKALVEGQGKLAPGQAAVNPIQILITGPSTAGNNAKNTAINPAWYDTLWHVIYTGMWDGQTSVSKQQQIFQGVHDAAERLRELVPDSGVYQNEVDVYQSNHIEDFWGRENYDRLVSIKQKVDPSNFFSVWQGIGWEGPDDSKWQCYKQNAVPGVDLTN